MTKPHPLVEELTAAAERFDQMWRAEYGPFTRLAAVRRPIVRMRRIWHALITEALFRGYSLHVNQDRRNRYDMGRLVVQIGPDAYDIDLRGDSTTPLRLSVPDDTQRRRRSDGWADKNGGPIERRLGEVFTTIELRAERAIEQRAAQERRDAERHQEWKSAMREATRRYEEDQRREVIGRRVADVEYTDDVRAYARALVVRAAEVGPPRDDSVRAWAEWAREHADSIDPRRLKAGMPTIPEPQPEQLKPYLRGFSPYGPY